MTIRHLHEKLREKVHEVWINPLLHGIDHPLTDLPYTTGDQNTTSTDISLVDQLLSSSNNRSELILLTGADGSGKTTTVLQLCTSLIETDTLTPIYFQLATWDPAQTTFEKWLIMQGMWDYQLTRWQMRRLLSGIEPLLFIFDGLDELALEHHAHAFREIVQFKTKSEHVVLVTNISDGVHQLKHERLEAVCVDIQPLSNEHIRNILEHSPINRNFLATNFPELIKSQGWIKAARNPLLLSLMRKHLNPSHRQMITDTQRYAIDLKTIKEWLFEQETAKHLDSPMLTAMAASMTRWHEPQFNTLFLYQGWLLGSDYPRPRRRVGNFFESFGLLFLEAFGSAFFALFVYGLFLILIPPQWEEFILERYIWLTPVTFFIGMALAGVGAYLSASFIKYRKLYDFGCLGAIGLFFAVVLGLNIGNLLGSFFPWEYGMGLDDNHFLGIQIGVLLHLFNSSNFPSNIIRWFLRVRLSKQWPLDRPSWEAYLNQVSCRSILSKSGKNWIFSHRLYRDYLAAKHAEGLGSKG